MANTKITELSSITSATTDDVLPIVNDPTGTAVTNKITFDNLQKSATQVGKVVITQPATIATIDITDGKTLTVANNASVSGVNTGDQDLSGYATSSTVTGTYATTSTLVGSYSTTSTIGGTYVTSSTVSGTYITSSTVAAQYATTSVMIGDSGSGGVKGLVPAPASGDAAAGKFLKADGNWTAPTSSGSTPQGMIMWDCNTFVDAKKYAQIQATNSGTIVDGAGGISLKTNSTANATIQLGGNTIGGDYPFPSAFDKKLDFGANWLPSSDSTGAYTATMLFGYAGASPVNSVLTSKHFGFIITETNIYASNANDTNQTKTDITSSLSITRPSYWRAVLTPATNIKFYVNASLLVTHTTNLPTGDFDYAKSWSASLQNRAGNATNRTGTVGTVSLQFNAE